MSFLSQTGFGTPTPLVAGGCSSFQNLQKQTRSRGTKMAHNNKLMRCGQHKGSVLRLVSPGLQSLQEICYFKISIMTVKSCRRRLNETFSFDGYGRAIRQFLTQLPVTVREHILENRPKVFIPRNYPFDLYLHEVLFSTGMRELSFILGSDYHQRHVESFFNLASVEGKELRTLKLNCYPCIQFSYKPRIYEQMKQVLVSAQNLLYLKLTDICDDTILKLIGENCTRVQNLDVVSSNITPKGVHYLTQNFVRHPTETKQEQRVWRSNVWELPGIFPPLEELLPEGEPVKFYERKKSPLCSTLKFLNIGILDELFFEAMLGIIELIPNLESIGRDLGTELFLEELWNKWYKIKKANDNFTPHTLNLTSIEVNLMEESIFCMIIEMCPKLQNIRYDLFDPNIPSSFSLSSFNNFRYLQSMDISHMRWVLQCESLGDLSEETRDRLKEISIDNRLAEKPFDISGVQLCSSLRLLDLRFPTIFWKGTSNGVLLPLHDTMQDLCIVDLQGNVTGKAVLSLLECAPNLEYLTVSDIIERKEDFLQRILEMRKMPRLETFEVIDGFLLDTEDELQSFVTHFERLQHVGKIRFLSNQGL